MKGDVCRSHLDFLFPGKQKTMKQQITEQQVKEICNTYPNPNVAYPRPAFEEQLGNHLRKYFGIKIKQKIKEEEKKGKVKKK